MSESPAGVVDAWLCAWIHWRGCVCEVKLTDTCSNRSEMTLTSLATPCGLSCCQQRSQWRPKTKRCAHLRQISNTPRCGCQRWTRTWLVPETTVDLLLMLSCVCVFVSVHLCVSTNYCHLYTVLHTYNKKTNTLCVDRPQPSTYCSTHVHAFIVYTYDMTLKYTQSIVYTYDIHHRYILSHTCIKHDDGIRMPLMKATEASLTKKKLDNTYTW